MAALAALTSPDARQAQVASPHHRLATSHSVQTDVAKMGDVTLTVWDQEVRGGQDEQMKQLNQAFQTSTPT